MKTCKKGHMYGSERPQCPECKLLAKHALHARRPESRKPASLAIYKARQLRWRTNNPEYNRQYKASNRTKINENAASRKKTGSDALSDRYLKEKLGDYRATPYLISLKREQLQIHRALKDLANQLKEKK